MLEEYTEFSDDEEQGHMPSTAVLSPPRPIIPAGLDATPFINSSIIPANETFSAFGNTTRHHSRTDFPSQTMDVKPEPKSILIDEQKLKLPTSNLQALDDMARSFMDQEQLQELVLLHSQCACAGYDYREPMDKSFLLALKLLKQAVGSFRNTQRSYRGSPLTTLASIVLVSHKQVSHIKTSDDIGRFWKKKYMNQVLALLGGVQDGLAAFAKQCTEESQHQYAMEAFLVQATILRGRDACEELVQLGKTCADCNYPALAATCFRGAIGTNRVRIGIDSAETAL